MKADQSSIIVEIAGRHRGFRLDRRLVNAVVRTTLVQQGVRRAWVDVCITDNKGIRVLNRRFLSRSRITDVISFDLSDDGKGSRLFSVVANAELAAREARRRLHRPEAELLLYIVHGLLHCLGFDDRRKSDACRMHRTEDEILKKHGCGAVYGER
jgi:probable rRNA maturation factor